MKKLLKLSGIWLVGIAIFYVIGKVQVGFSYFRPFGVSLLFAMLLNRVKIKSAGVLFLVGNILAGFDLNSIYISLNVVAVYYVMIVIQSKIKKLNNWLMILPILFSNILYCYLGCGGAKQNLAMLLSLLLCVLFYFICLSLGGAMVKRGNIALNLDEKICGGVLVVVVAMGLSSLNLYDFSFLKFVSVLTILICSHCFQSGTTFLISALLGFGEGLLTLNLQYVALFVGFSLVSLAFRTNYKVFSAVAVFLLEILYGLYFKSYPKFNFVSLLATILPCMIFSVLPKSWLNYIKDIFAYKRDKIAVRSLVNRTKAGICKRMNELSQVFMEMNTVFRGMVKGVLSEEDAVEMISQEISQKVCVNCPDRAKCMRNNNTMDTFRLLTGNGFERGKVTLLDVPQYLVSKCGRVNFLLSTLNQSIKSYKNYTQLVGSMDSSRVLIADQLGGVSEILKKLGEEIRLNITFDQEKENRILEELNYKNIICYEAIVYEENEYSKSVSLLLKNEKMDDKVIEKAVSDACRVKMQVVGRDVASIPNSKVLHLKNSPNYDLVFGVASVSKNGVLNNGDAHSLIKIDNGKYILTLCDGIGSGEKAQKISSLSISLIENFYKAGFENDTILNSVNKLLSLNNDENFSSVDLCVMDFHKNLIDFIKLGATYGFVKNKSGTTVIESSGLPIGILEEMRPHLTQKIIEAFDTIILVSDGITDVFDNKSDLQDYINSLSSTNPQTIADDIMDRAKDLNNGIIKDDMTVLVVRIYPI